MRRGGLLPFVLSLCGLVSASQSFADTTCPPYPPRCTEVREVVVGVTNEGPILKDRVWAMLYRQNLRALARKVEGLPTVEVMIAGKESTPERFRASLLRLRDECLRIKALLIDGHGHPGRQETAGEINPQNVRDYFEGLHCLMATQAKVQFSGCNAGEGCVGWHLLALTGSALLTRGGEIYGATIPRVPTFIDGHTDFGFHKRVEFNSNGGITHLRNDWPVIGEGPPSASCGDRLVVLAKDLRRGSGIPPECDLTPFTACLPAAIRDRCQFQIDFLEKDFRAASAAHRHLKTRFAGVDVPFSDTPVHRAEAAAMLDLERSVETFQAMDCSKELRELPDRNPACLVQKLQACFQRSNAGKSCQ